MAHNELTWLDNNSKCVFTIVSTEEGAFDGKICILCG